MISGRRPALIIKVNSFLFYAAWLLGVTPKLYTPQAFLSAEKYFTQSARNAPLVK